MGNIDKTKTILLIEARNPRAEEVFNSEDNEDYLVDDTEKVSRLKNYLQISWGSYCPKAVMMI